MVSICKQSLKRKTVPIIKSIKHSINYCEIIIVLKKIKALYCYLRNYMFRTDDDKLHILLVLHLFNKHYPKVNISITIFGLMRMDLMTQYFIAGHDANDFNMDVHCKTLEIQKLYNITFG